MRHFNKWSVRRELNARNVEKRRVRVKMEDLQMVGGKLKIHCLSALEVRASKWIYWWWDVFPKLHLLERG